MTRKVISPPDWFKLSNYNGTDRLDFEGWRTQIGSRIGLKAMLDANATDQFDSSFKEIQTSPFYDIGFSDTYKSSNAVYPLTFGVASALVDALESLKPEPSASCDQRLSETGQVGFGMHAHLTVDLNASEMELRKAFKNWVKGAITENRQRTARSSGAGISKSVIDGWCTHKILPYQDLFLWCLRYEQKMPSDSVVADWLFADSIDDHGGDKDTVREARNKAEQVFSLPVLRRLSLVAT